MSGLFLRVVVGVALAAALAGCGGEAPGADEVPVPTSDPSSVVPPRTAPPLDTGTGSLPDAVSVAVTPTGRSVEVRDAPEGTLVHTLQNPRPSGAPLTFLLDDDPGGEWIRVLLPVRPNGSTGWLRRDDVTLSEVGYRLEMSTSDNELSLFSGNELVDTFPAASGTGDTPTPLGTF